MTPPPTPTPSPGPSPFPIPGPFTCKFTAETHLDLHTLDLGGGPRSADFGDHSKTIANVSGAVFQNSCNCFGAFFSRFGQRLPKHLQLFWGAVLNISANILGRNFLNNYVSVVH